MGPVVIGNATLYLGDCREILPTLPKVDAVVTDPPYGIGEKMRGGTWGAADKYADFRRWDIAPDDSAIAKLLAMADTCIVWGGNYFSLPPSRCWLSWQKSNAVPTMADFELAWTNIDKPCKQFKGKVGTHEYGHPTEKPVRLMEWCLEHLGDARVVLDPYMGSGTTGVACVTTGRGFIGIEAEQRYFDISCERIYNAQRQQRLLP